MIIYSSIDELLLHIKGELDQESPLTLLFAANGVGKTRLSKSFYDQFRGEVLYYNAFTEDLFHWDNESCILVFDPHAWIFRVLFDQGLDQQVIDNFKKFTGLKVEPSFDFKKGYITFRLPSNSDLVKISRGEESVFIWSLFYTVLDEATSALAEKKAERTTSDFDQIRYFIIDDPVSSLDDSKIITIALTLANLVLRTKNSSATSVRFLVSTHHALFFNILFNSWNRPFKGKKFYILSNIRDQGLLLEEQRKDSPFGYHHLIISEIQKAIETSNIRRYHFNLYRTLLEKTANFLGYQGWKEVLPEKTSESIIRCIDHYSHNSLSDFEQSNLAEEDKVAFKTSFQGFMSDFKWKLKDD